MGAAKRPQLRRLDPNWTEKIWERVCDRNGGKGAAWKLALAALAVTGCRPASLEKGMLFEIKRDSKTGERRIVALIQGSKVDERRGQEAYQIIWVPGKSHLPIELQFIEDELERNHGQLVVRYDAEAISTRLREVSQELWPTRRHHVTAYCYRHLFSSAAKAAGMAPEMLARGMGHLSAESQGKYGRGRPGRGGNGPPPFLNASATHAVKTARAPMARFRQASAIKRRRNKPA